MHKSEIIQALDTARLGYVSTHDGETARCGKWSQVTPLGAILQSQKWNFHLVDAWDALDLHPFLAELTTEWELCGTSQLDIEEARLYALIYAEAFCPKRLELEFI